MPSHHELPHDHLRPDPGRHGRLETWWVLLGEALRWRPGTVLGYLILVALLGILVALLLIVGVQFHLVRRFL